MQKPQICDDGAYTRGLGGNLENECQHHSRHQIAAGYVSRIRRPEDLVRMKRRQTIVTRCSVHREHRSMLPMFEGWTEYND